MPECFRGSFRYSLPLLVAFAACDEAPLPAGPLTPDGAVLATSQPDPGLVPNAVPYRAPGYLHGTGRSGGATVTARALLGPDGPATLEVTTGELDGPPSSVTLDRLQLKLMDETGGLLEVRHVRDVDAGSTTLELPLSRHQQVQVQAQARAPNPAGRDRTGVITVLERVNLRPDLAVSLNVPIAALPGSPVTLGAEVTERNGDVGARTDCVLYVDGAEADRAEGIWVAEGDRVACLFTHAFPSPGSYALRVVAENVRPADWDATNNQATGTLTVTEPGHTLTAGGARVHERHIYALEHRWGRNYPGYSGARQYEWDYTGEYIENRRHVDVHGRAPSQGFAYENARFHLFAASEGRTVLDVEAPWRNAYGGRHQQCVFSRHTVPDGGLFYSFQACEYFWADPDIVETILYTVQGQAAYLSTGYYRYRYGSSGGWHYVDLTWEADYGPAPEWGSQLEVTYWVDVGPRYSAAVTVPLVPYAVSYPPVDDCSYHSSGFSCVQRPVYEWWGKRGELYY